MPDDNSPVPATTKVYFGVSLELNGTVISLEPKNAIQDLKTKGIEVELPPGERVYLGTAGGSLKSIFNTLGVDDLDDYVNDDGTLNEQQLPDIAPLRTAARIVSSAGLYVEEFHLRIPGRNPTNTANPDAIQNTKDSTAYTVAVSAEWKDGQGRLIEGLDLQLRGLYFKVSNQS
jgi:hypothetical protein